MSMKHVDALPEDLVLRVPVLPFRLGLQWVPMRGARC